MMRRLGYYVLGLLMGFYLGRAAVLSTVEHKQPTMHSVVVSGKVVATTWSNNQLTIVLPTNGEDKDTYWQCSFHGNRYKNVQSCVEFEMKEDK